MSCKCNACSKNYATRQSLWKHKQRCRGKPYHKSYPEKCPNQFSFGSTQGGRQDTTDYRKERSRSLSEELRTTATRSGDTTPLNFHSIDEERKSKLSTPQPHDDETSTEEEEEEEEQERSSQANNSEDGTMINSLTIGEENSTSPDEEEEEEEESTIIDSLVNDDDSVVSPAEDDEDIIKDASVWHTINFWAEKHDCSVLDSFKFFFQLSRALDHDATIEKIMDSVHAIRDGSDYTIGFKTALDHALEKRKFLIKISVKEHMMDGHEADDENEEDKSSTASEEAEHMNVWKLILDESKDGGDLKDIFETLRCYILLCRSLKRDKVFRSVMEMVRDWMDYDLDPMDFQEAIDYTIDQKRAIIFETARAAAQQCTPNHNNENRGSGLFLSPYSHKGGGMMDDGSSDEDDDDQMDKKIWEIIALT